VLYTVWAEIYVRHRNTAQKGKVFYSTYYVYGFVYYIMWTYIK